MIMNTLRDYKQNKVFLIAKAVEQVKDALFLIDDSLFIEDILRGVTPLYYDEVLYHVLDDENILFYDKQLLASANKNYEICLEWLACNTEETYMIDDLFYFIKEISYPEQGLLDCFLERRNMDIKLAIQILGLASNNKFTYDNIKYFLGKLDDSLFTEEFCKLAIKTCLDKPLFLIVLDRFNEANSMEGVPYEWVIRSLNMMNLVERYVKGWKV